MQTGARGREVGALVCAASGEGSENTGTLWRCIETPPTNGLVGGMNARHQVSCRADGYRIRIVPKVNVVVKTLVGGQLDERRRIDEDETDMDRGVRFGDVKVVVVKRTSAQLSECLNGRVDVCRDERAFVHKPTHVVMNDVLE